MRFEFLLPGQAGSQLSHAELKLQPEEAATLAMRITPNKRQFFGVAKHNYMYTVTATPLSGVQTPRSVLGQAASAPLIGPWVIALAALLLAILLVFIFRPTISYFGPDQNMQVNNRGEVVIDPGQEVSLFWRASRFSGLRISSDTPQDPQAGPVSGPVGSKVLAPEITTVYTLHAENLLTRLQERLFGPTAPVRIVVNAVRPAIVFTLIADNPTKEGDNTYTIIHGQSVTLQWKVSGADEVFLRTNGADREPIRPSGTLAALRSSPILRRPTVSWRRTSSRRPRATSPTWSSSWSSPRPRPCPSR